MNAAIIVAGGKSKRMGPGADKAFLSLGAKPVLAYSLLAFEACADIDVIILVVRKDRVEAARGMAQMFGCSKVRKIVAGGASRQKSVLNGMSQLSEEDTKIVSVHDGARPCVTPALISETIKTAKRAGSGVAAVKITDTVKTVERGLTVTSTVDRTKLWAVQTPQSFKFDVLVKAFDKVKKKKMTVTDEASAVEEVTDKVRLVPANAANIKITNPDDLQLASALLKL